MAREMIPWERGEGQRLAQSRERGDFPFFSLSRELDRLFSDMLRGWNEPTITGGAAGTGWPQLEIRETDTEVRIAAELPGMTDKDVELSIDEGMLILRGERQEEKDDKARGYSERHYGRFERRIAVPRGIDEEKVQARFESGLLTITLPKGPEAERGRRIPINAETRH